MQTRRADHFDFLDGVRGLSAFYVLLTHAYNLLFYAGIGDEGPWAHRLMIGLKPLAFGRYAVDMFIVLSGYCLMLPVVRIGGLLRGGFNGYLKRRAIRILPPYYAAFALSLLVLCLRRAWLRQTTGEDAGPGDLLSHLLLIHNLFNRWAHSINSPLWSVASEWQIYFFFPLVLLPVWKRWNITTTVVIAFLLGYSLQLLVPGGLDSAAPWYIGLFAMGMAAAVVTVTPLSLPVPWGKCCGILAALLAVSGSLTHSWFRDHAWFVDPIFGLAAVSLILSGVEALPRDRADSPPFVLRVLRAKWIVALGAFSYSLYLIHYPFIDLSGSLFQHFAVSPNLQIALTFGVCVPAITGLAYLFHLGFERPFMPGQPRTHRAAEIAAEVSPAP